MKSICKIENDNDLYLYIIEHNLEGINIPILEYDFFIKENNKGKFLNLSNCRNYSIVDIKIHPKVAEEDIDQCIPTSDIYKNSCNKQSENGVDLTIYDRKNRFNDKNMALCEKGCEFIQYNTTTKIAECDCFVKINYNFDENNADINDLVAKIDIDDKSKSNYNLNLMKCDILSNKENIITNTGFIVLGFFLFIFIIIFIIFCAKGKQQLANQIEKVIYNYFEKKQGVNNNKNKNTSDNSSNKTKRRDKELSRKEDGEQELKLKSKKISKKKNKEKNKGGIKNVRGKNKITNETTKNEINIKKNVVIPKMNDYELNNLSYIDAINYDKRISCDYYCSLIKNKQLFMFTFCSFTDYNSGVIKKFIFFLSFAVHYTINALWFNDSTMHQIYKDEGSFNFKKQLLAISVSALSATIFLRLILETLVLTERSIVKVKKTKSYEAAMKMKDILLKNFNIKFAIFFVINFILLVAFWYYLTCFNAIYSNTQIYLIENTLISFAFSFFYPIIFNILPTALRSCALNDAKKDGQSLYSTSQILQII